MPIIKTISRTDFHDAFRQAGREYQFSYEALNALYDYLVEMYESQGTTYELDVIALCCEFSEYKSGAELFKNHPQYLTLDEIEDKTLLLELPNGGYLIQNF